MYYMYLLRSRKSHKFYVGSTSDLRKRFNSHNAGQNIATKSDTPWDIIYYEAYLTKGDAIRRELKLKHHGKGLAELKKRFTLVEE
jgi:putative endonuclease